MKETRSCIVCRHKRQKSELIRIVKDIGGSAIFDKIQKENKRGVYFCKNPECIRNAIKKIDKNKLNNLKVEMDKQSLKSVLEKILVELGE